MLWRWKALDHRRRPATVPKLVLSRKRLFGPGSGWDILFVFFGARCLVGMAMSLARELLPSDVPFVVGAALSAVSVMLVLLIVLVAIARLATPTVGAAIDYPLADGRCPPCGYQIKSAPPQSDGCVECPECGAAWRLPAPGPPTDPEMRPSCSGEPDSSVTRPRP